MAPDTLPDPLRVALAAVAVLDQLGVAYATAGSLASSLHGEPRSSRQELARWAALLGVSDLLQRALTEAER